jgi:hypothetical protein
MKQQALKRIEITCGIPALLLSRLESITAILLTTFTLRNKPGQKPTLRRTQVDDLQTAT